MSQNTVGMMVIINMTGLFPKKFKFINWIMIRYAKTTNACGYTSANTDFKRLSKSYFGLNIAITNNAITQITKKTNKSAGPKKKSKGRDAAAKIKGTDLISFDPLLSIAWII